MISVVYERLAIVDDKVAVELLAHLLPLDSPRPKRDDEHPVVQSHIISSSMTIPGSMVFLPRPPANLS